MPKYIPRFFEVIEPLVALTRKEVAQHRVLRKFWNAEHTRAFLTVKRLLANAPTLYFPNMAQEFIVHSDASDLGAGAMLPQKHGSSEAVIAYFSKRLTASQQWYSATAKECYGIVLAIQHWRGYLWGRYFPVVTDHGDRKYLYSMQDASNMLARWAIALQAFDFSVVHTPGSRNVIPDMLSRLFAFEQQESNHTPPTLALICRNVPDNPVLHDTAPDNTFRLSMDSMHNLQPAMSDRELFSTALHTSATDVFMTIDPAKLRHEQEVEFSDYLRFLRDSTAPIPPKETVASMSFYFIHDGLLYKSYYPRHIRRRSTVHDQLVVPQKLISLMLHACHDHVLSGGRLGFKPTLDKIFRYWWPTLSRDVPT